MNATALLSQFRIDHSERAFSELVGRYANLVFSVAQRRTGNAALAQEISQIVFIRLARTSPSFKNDSDLVAWLHRTTVNASIDLWRSESRRQAREQHAVAMQSEPVAESPWTDVAPAVDAALDELSDGDRRALLLRFFESQAMREIGVAFGITEDAAKMRVSRAVDRLREKLLRQGVACTAAGLSALLLERAVEAAPAGWADTLAAARYPAAVGAGAWLGFLGGTNIGPIAAGLAVAVVVATGVFVASHRFRSAALSQKSAGAAGNSAGLAITNLMANAASNLNPDPSSEVTTNGNAAGPDPLGLLARVANARHALVSGSLEYIMFSENFSKPVRETNYVRFKAVFDESRIWFESFGREYRYAKVGGDAGKLADPIIAEQGLDREGAVRAGLLEPFEAHIVTLSDGTNWMKHRETDGRSDGAIVDDPKNGSSQSADRFFDPRCLGLYSLLHYGTTVDLCLGYANAKSIKLVGRESWEGTPVWHVEVVNRHGAKFDFWLDVARPERVLRAVCGQDWSTSQYDPRSADPIPVVTVTSQSNGKFRCRYTRIAAAYDAPVDPATWTLAGLNMPTGTIVNDLRNHRTIGYWTGNGLTASPPLRNPGPQAKGRRDSEPKNAESPPVRREEMLAMLDQDPVSPEGLNAAEWVFLNTPDGPDVEKAADAIRLHHITSTNLVRLAKELDRMRPRSARSLLVELLEKNPAIEVRAAACFSLAAIVHDDFQSTHNPKIAAEDEKLQNRIINEFADVRPDGPVMVTRARRQLGQLRIAGVGKPAPELIGESVDGRAVRLADYQGKVVFVIFWCSYFEKDALRSFSEGMAGREFEMIGVACRDANNREKLRATIEQNAVTWPIIWDTGQGALHAGWFIDSWPTIFVIDRAGTIRYRGSFTDELYKVMKSLVGG